MKIIFDKLDNPPRHALNRQEAKMLFGLIAKEWKLKLSAVYFKATLPYNSRFERPVIYSSLGERLNVCSRGLSRKQACQEILRELAIRALHIQIRMVHRLSHTELKRVDEIIAPFLLAFETRVCETGTNANAERMSNA